MLVDIKKLIRFFFSNKLEAQTFFVPPSYIFDRKFHLHFHLIQSLSTGFLSRIALHYPMLARCLMTRKKLIKSIYIHISLFDTYFEGFVKSADHLRPPTVRFNDEVCLLLRSEEDRRCSNQNTLNLISSEINALLLVRTD